MPKICLSVKPTCYVHVCKAVSAKEAWENLQTAFEAKSMNRRFGVQKHLFGNKIENVSSVEEYLNDILRTVHKLADIGMLLDDEFVAFVMLNGLSSDYDPPIMTLTYTNNKLYSEVIKTKLLEESARRKAHSNDSDSVLYSRAGSCKQTFKRFPQPTLNWIIDSGATSHMSEHGEGMSNYKKDSVGNIVTANNQTILYKGSGDIEVNLNQDGNIVTKTVCDDMLLPDLALNLLSDSKMTKKGYIVVFDRIQCQK